MSSATISYGEGRTDFQPDAKPEPLSEREKALLTRLLSDPAELPKEFKLWITQHSSDTVDIAKTQVHGLVNNAGQVVIGGASMANLGAALPGCIFPYAAAAAPEGWILCDGREILRAEYSVLFTLIGTSWGTPSAPDKFKVPDFRGRAPFGADSNVPFTGNEGAGAGARGPKHYHRVYDSRAFSGSGSGVTNPDGTHQHAMGGGIGTIAGSQPGSTYEPIHGGLLTSADGAHAHGFAVTVAGVHTIDVNTYGAAGPQDQPGWVGLNFIMGSGKLP